MAKTAKKKALLIFNPNAGIISRKDTEKNVKEKLAAFGYDFIIYYLNADFEARIAGENFRDIDLVVAVGGDGTAKVAGRTILEKNISAPLAIIPFGSANVLAASLGLPLSVGPALDLIKDGKPIKIDVGLINKKHYFLVGFSAGYISKIVVSTDHKLKNKLGTLGYFLKFVFNNFKIKRQKFQIKTKDGFFEIKGNSIVIFNALSYLGLRPKRPIDFSDGILNLYVFTNRTFIGMWEAFFYMLWHHEPPRHIFTLDADKFKIILKRELKTCQADGDYLRLPSEINIELLKSALTVLVKK